MHYNLIYDRIHVSFIIRKFKLIIIIVQEKERGERAQRMIYITLYNTIIVIIIVCKSIINFIHFLGVLPSFLKSKFCSKIYTPTHQYQYTSTHLTVKCSLSWSLFSFHWNRLQAPTNGSAY